MLSSFSKSSLTEGITNEKVSPSSFSTTKSENESSSSNRSSSPLTSDTDVLSPIQILLCTVKSPYIEWHGYLKQAINQRVVECTGRLWYDVHCRGKTPIIKNEMQGKAPITKNGKRGDIISKLINVVDCSDIPLEPTYPKRALQLVKNQRADWISEDTIRMKLQNVEGNLMTAENTVTKSIDSSTFECSEEIKGIQTPNDETIMELAKRRLAIKKNLIYQTLDYMLILMCFTFLVLERDRGSKALISIMFTLFWGIRLIYRIYKFEKPSFQNGIGAYIKKRNDYQLESEFNRLKKEYLNNH
ncbi:MAG: hypothetical protein E7251_01070 [Paenibacillaceae bacterium]|nr:hypothetical protein [Paenibacillaceae bacterium]